MPLPPEFRVSNPLKYHLLLPLRDFAVRKDIPLALDVWGTRPEGAEK